MLPEWLSIKPASTGKYAEIRSTIKDLGLHTVCVEAHCPNMAECWSSGTATFMVLGDLCTRGCTFCVVRKSAKGLSVDRLEPEKLAEVVEKWGLDYIVLTSVCRDDLPDQGAGHFAECVSAIKRRTPGTLVEVLIPDFRGEKNLLEKIARSKPDVIGHNIETVERLSPFVRDRRASYRQSLSVLKGAKGLDGSIYTKSAMMLGMGETDEEIFTAFEDLRSADVDFLAMGQYLRPTEHHSPVREYVTPERFEYLRKRALEQGFLYVAAGPFVRSSYKAGEFFIKTLLDR